jgi:ribonuclease E
MDRKVWLPSGGSLVIDRTEAMTVVDVNTGKFVGSGGNLEETVTKNNLEAAEEIVRQLRLRDIGGIIVIDFIDMVLESNRDLVVRRLLECLGRDRTKHQVAEVTSLGLVQMTRKRVGLRSPRSVLGDLRSLRRSRRVGAQPPGVDGGSGGSTRAAPAPTVRAATVRAATGPATTRPEESSTCTRLFALVVARRRSSVGDVLLIDKVDSAKAGDERSPPSRCCSSTATHRDQRRGQAGQGVGQGRGRQARPRAPRSRS